MNTYPINRSKKYESNVARLGYGYDTCVCCGLRTAEKLFIHASTEWVAVDQESEFPESQGYFPVGPECAKKFPKKLIFSTVEKVDCFSLPQKKRILARRIEIAVQNGESIEDYLFVNEDSFDYNIMLDICRKDSEYGFEV